VAASNGALAAAIRPHHHQRRPLLGRQMLVVGSHRNTLPDKVLHLVIEPALQLWIAYRGRGGMGTDQNSGQKGRRLELMQRGRLVSPPMAPSLPVHRGGTSARPAVGSSPTKLTAPRLRCPANRRPPAPCPLASLPLQPFIDSAGIVAPPGLNQTVVVRAYLGRRGRGIRLNLETQVSLGLGARQKAYIRERPSSLSSAWRGRDPGA
jgi:hypothetical protein